MRRCRRTPPVPVTATARRLLPPQEVYTVLRDGGFSPLGAPQQRGFVYTIAVIDRRGEDGRLVIDARNGQILRFVPAYRMGDNFGEEPPAAYGPAGPRAGQPGAGRAAAAGLDPACRQPHAVGGAAAEGLAAARRRVSRWPQARRRAGRSNRRRAGQAGGCATAAPAAAPAAVEAKPAPQILPTQEMPKAQGLD